MELRTLYYFLAVAREQNITRASEQLHVGQPTLSRQLMQLEEEVGTQLLIRGKRKIQLTESGMLLRRRAEEILSLVDKTEKELLHDEENIEGEVFIGVGECFASHLFLPQLIESFSKKYPKVTFNIYTGNADLIKERLDQGMIDIGILLEPVDVEKYDFIRLPQKERWGILVSHDHPLSQKDHVTSKDLIGVPLTKNYRSIVQSEIAGWFQSDYEKLNFLLTANFMTNIITLVEKNICVAMTIEGAFYNHSKEKVTFVPLYPELITGTVLVWKKHQILSPLIQAFVDEVYHAINE